MIAPVLLPFVHDVANAISEVEFRLFQRLILQETGIRLNETKKALLVGRLWKRVRELGVSSFREYYLRVREDAQEQLAMIDLITTNETSFFREPKQFELLARQIIPEWMQAAESLNRPRSLRVWSAGCSTGEEPYSVAALLAAHCPDWDIEILATDLSTRVLRAAAEGVWPIERAGQIPQPYLTRFFLRGVGAKRGQLKATRALRQLIRFRRVNLHDEHLDAGPFDLVLCRNVLIYFAPEGRAKIVRRLLERTHRGGYLFLGHAETLDASAMGVKPLASAVWMRR